MRQLWVFTFCIHTIKNNRAKFYIYHEGHGRKSRDEVCTFLLDYMTNKLPLKVKNFILFSGSCGGQNKNHTLIRFLRNLSDNKVFESITHYFPIRGHSLRSRLIRQFYCIYTPKQYAELITRASKLNKFSVKMIDAMSLSHGGQKSIKKQKF